MEKRRGSMAFSILSAEENDLLMHTIRDKSIDRDSDPCAMFFDQNRGKKDFRESSGIPGTRECAHRLAFQGITEAAK